MSRSSVGNRQPTLPREANAEQRSAPPEAGGINRRTIATAGIATLIFSLATPAGAQELPPTPDDLERELPSPRKAPAVGAKLSELPPPEPAGVSEGLFPGFVAQNVQTSGATIMF